ncbi:transcription initiation factor TFIID subunit [Tieghemostelium lacteum]|uniref:Transcription initiation factor TFIID subunit n=1 Tax=Tieghemostelium lacteum TaxID=361077 RepID=A0A151Z337_TIELA|nr:transcription initiation factor TFIID subunit [Tieghemostelium lacteum]|eukprot:KYQ88361.1 transcription initiation factor TFIID subunit [Tieghemostelium lacteum]
MSSEDVSMIDNENNSTSPITITELSKQSLSKDNIGVEEEITGGHPTLNNNNIDITQTNLDEPRDARIIKSILNTMGVQSYDPRVVNQLLEFMTKYVFDILQDSQVYAEHSGKTEMDVSDVRLSIQSRVNHTSTPPPREMVVGIAEEQNKIPLPAIPNKFGVFLPPDEYCITNPNYQIVPNKPLVQPNQPLPPNTMKGQYNKKFSNQIPIKLNTNGSGGGSLYQQIQETTTTTITSPPPTLPIPSTITSPPPILPISSTIKPPVLNTVAPPTIKTTAPPIVTAKPPSVAMPNLQQQTTTTSQDQNKDVDMDDANNFEF